MGQIMKSSPPSIRQEIFSVIVVKILFLWGLWWLCFSHPVDASRMTDLAASHLFNSSTSHHDHPGAPDAHQS